MFSNNVILVVVVMTIVFSGIVLGVDGDGDVLVTRIQCTDTPCNQRMYNEIMNEFASLFGFKNHGIIDDHILNQHDHHCKHYKASYSHNDEDKDEGEQYARYLYYKMERGKQESLDIQTSKSIHNILINGTHHLIEIYHMNDDKESRDVYNDMMDIRDTSVWTLPTDPMYSQQWHLNDSLNAGMNFSHLFEMGYTGTGVTIAIVDDGIQWSHPDIFDNYNAESSWDFIDNDDDPSPVVEMDKYHGTASAGIAGAVSNNICGVGVSYRSKVSAIRLLGGRTNDLTQSMALSYKTLLSNWIVSSSWGPVDDGTRIDSPGYLLKQSMLHSVMSGRDGLGTIYVWAAGNGGTKGDNCAWDQYGSSRLVITVGSVDYNGIHANYSERCSALRVVTPSSGNGKGLITTDLLGPHGRSSGDCNDKFGGTSASAPLVAGVIALILEKEYNRLGWRDIQMILSLSTTVNDPEDLEWFRNGAGIMYNQKYGFGIVNVGKAIEIAHRWQPLPEYKTVRAPMVRVNGPLPEQVPLISRVYVDENISIEHVVITVDAVIDQRSDIQLVLISPSNTSSMIAEPRYNDQERDIHQFTFHSVHFLLEKSRGWWELVIQDIQSNQKLLNSLNWKLKLYGH